MKLFASSFAALFLMQVTVLSSDALAAGPRIRQESPAEVQRAIDRAFAIKSKPTSSHEESGKSKKSAKRASNKTKTSKR